MILRPFALLALLILLVLPAAAQTTPPPTASPAAFDAADIHASPRRSYPFFYAVLIKQDRYLMRDATMVDLIATAYNLDRDNVHGGPSWLELDRFDVVAKVPPGASKETQRLMLRTLLKERFNLALHNGTAPMPAFVLSAGKAKPKLKPAEGTGDPACEDKSPPHTGPTSYIYVSCHNLTMDDLAQQLHSLAGGYLDKPVVNSTGLEGSWDVDIKWTSRGDLEKAGPDGISIFDAVDKQFGLKLELQTAPRPVLLVDSVSEKPTPNAPYLEKVLPPPLAPQFEVATIKPSKPGAQGGGRISGGQVNFNQIPLRALIDLAWDLNENDNDNIVGAPKWLDDDHYDVLAKVASDSNGTSVAGNAGGLPMDIYEVEQMLRALLIERFQVKAHLEDRPTNAYTLLAPNSKLKAANPASRTLCKEGPGPDGKDPRLTTPILNRLVSCQNMTMQQICEELQRVANGYIFNSVLDGTGLKGSYDFTLSFSSAGRVLPGAPTTDGTPSDPNGALTLFDAVSRQLGLKLEKQKRPMPVLVLDHIEEKPTEN